MKLVELMKLTDIEYNEIQYQSLKKPFFLNYRTIISCATNCQSD